MRVIRRVAIVLGFENLFIFILFLLVSKAPFKWTHLWVLVLVLLVPPMIIHLFMPSYGMSILINRSCAFAIMTFWAKKHVRHTPLHLLLVCISFIVFFSITRVLGLMDHVLSSLLYTELPWVDIPMLIIVILLSVLFAKTIGRFINNHLHVLEDKKRRVYHILCIAMVVLAFSLVDTTSAIITADLETVMLLYHLLMLILLVFFVASFFFITYMVIKDRHLQNKDEILANLGAYTASIENMTSEVSRFRHDHLNMLLSMDAYLQQGDTDNLRAYFNAYMDSFRTETSALDSRLYVLQHIKMPAIKSIISAKLLLAQQQGIDVRVEVPQDIEVMDVYGELDLCRIAGIFLDNSTEACRGVPGSSLSFIALPKEGTTRFVFANTCQSPPDLSRLGDEGYTTKPGSRGLGLYNVRQLIRRNQRLSLNTYLDGGQFVQEVIILLN